MSQGSFLQLYAASLNNLVHPVDQELEEQFLAAKTVVSRVYALHAELHKLIDQLDSLAARHQVKKLLTSADDPITRSVSVLNECTERYEAFQASGKMTISDISKSCFGSKDIGIASKLIEEASQQVNRVTDFFQIVFHKYDVPLLEAHSRISIVKADVQNTVWGSCESALMELKGQLRGSTQGLTLSDAVRMADSSIVEKLDQLFAKLEKQCQKIEKEYADREEAARKAKSDRLQQDKERLRKLAEQEKERQRIVAEQERLLEQQELARIKAEEEAARKAKSDRLKQDKERLRKLAEQEKERQRIVAEQERLLEQQELAVTHLKSLSQGSNIAINVIVLLTGLCLLYFVVSDFIAFDSALIAAVLYALFSLAEAQGNLNKIKSEDLVPNFWVSTQVQGAHYAVFLIIAMFVQLLGGPIYVLSNWMWPVSWTWVGVIFPHTWNHALWYLLVAPMTLICVMSIPFCFYNLRIVAYARQLLKKYVPGR